jgi:hypothetical protein
MTNNQRWTDHGAHRHQPPLAPPDLQAKAAVMKAESEAVLSVMETQVAAAVVATAVVMGGDKDNGGNSDGGCTDTNNQQSNKSGGSHGDKNNDGW